MTTHKLQIAADSANTSSVLAFVEDSLTSDQVPIKLRQKILICTDEIFANIVQYSSAILTEIQCSVSETQVTVKFTDDGIPYNPLNAPAPDILQSAEERKIGGYGIHIVKKLMDEVRYDDTDKKNNLTIVKYIHQ